MIASHVPHERVRQTKRWLRFLPRRAVLHRYPLIGRFAHAARRRAELWSFKRQPVRRAFYGGSILSLLPLMGIQLPLGFVFALLTRANLMIIGALQFITNPFTAVPIYGATFVLGRKLLRAVGLEMAGAKLPDGWQEMGLRESFRQIELGTALGHGLTCLIVGGVIAGLILGAVLDAIYYLAASRAPAIRPGSGASSKG